MNGEAMNEADGSLIDPADNWPAEAREGSQSKPATEADGSTAEGASSRSMLGGGGGMGRGGGATTADPTTDLEAGGAGMDHPPLLDELSAASALSGLEPDLFRDASAGGYSSAEGAEGGFFSSDGLEGLDPSTLGHRRKPVRKTLRPSSAQLHALFLKPGANAISFKVHSSLQGTQILSSTIYLLSPRTKLVVSDIDGTITKSDVLGQLMPRVGVDWSHLGVTQLYQSCVANGYQMLYLTARGIGMATTTREYLESIDQEGCTLPPGPCLLSPSRLLESFTREIIRRNPEEFKIACLREVRELWPPEHNPFYAGFGNRDSDEMAYVAAGMPRARIFIINPQSEIRMAGQAYTYATYPRLQEIAHEMFPAISLDAEGDTSEEFSEVNFWRRPTPMLEGHGEETPPASAPAVGWRQASKG